MAINFLSQLFSPGPGLDGSNMGAPGSMPSPLVPPPVAPQMDPANAMQNLNGQPGVMPDAAPVPDQSAAPPRARRSILDTVGRLADVFATVGGAQALYQPTLDAREDRGFAIEDRARGIDMDKLKQELAGQQVEAGEGALGDAENGRVVQAARGIEALRRANPQTDIARVVPLLFKQAGVSDERAAALTEAIGQNPDLLSGLIAGDGESEKYGGSIVYGKDANGKLVAYQPGLSSNGGRNVLPEGVTPIDPQKFVDVGNAQVGVGTRSGTVGTTLTKGERPGFQGGVPIRERPGFRGGRPIAPAPPRAGAGAGKTPSPSAMAKGAAPVVAALEDSVKRLYKSGGMTDGNSGTIGTLSAMARENVPGLERLTNSEGFSAREDLNRLLTVGIPSLLPLMGGLSLGGKNIDAAKELDTWRKAIASAKDYPSAMRAINGFKARIRELSAPGAPAARRPGPTRNSAAPAAGGWGKATVVR